MTGKFEGKNHLEDQDVDDKTILQEVPGRSDRLLSFDTTQTAQKTIRRGTHRQQGYLISSVPKIREGYIDRQTDSQVIS
jgi:hypothetical protein